MKYVRKILGKLPMSAKRRKARRAVDRLWSKTPLLKTERQSDGPLYESFLRSEGKDIYKFHHYFDIYQRHLGQYVGRPLRFLEIGVLRGGSQRMWRDYFGPDAVLVGIDIDAGCAALDGKYGAVRIGDQSDERFLSSLCEEFGPFDAVLDDGGHDPSQQIISFGNLYPNLAADGVYIVEDVQTNFWPSRQDMGSRMTFVNFAARAARQLSEAQFRRSDLERLGRPPADREGTLEVSRMAATTYGVHFYDSIIVFERRPKAEPWHEIR